MLTVYVYVYVYGCALAFLLRVRAASSKAEYDRLLYHLLSCGHQPQYGSLAPRHSEQV
jgi:hypothetical protein